MAEFKRSKYVFFYFEDGSFLNIHQLLRQVVAVEHVEQTYAISVICGEVVPITNDQLTMLRCVPSDSWTRFDDLTVGQEQPATEEDLDFLVEKGLLLCNDERPAPRELVRRHDLLDQQQWNIFAALYHFSTKWKSLNVGTGEAKEQENQKTSELATDEFFEEFIARHGKPPSHFHSVNNSISTVELEATTRAHALYGVLECRRTTREFDTAVALKQADLSSLLRYGFGSQSYSPVYRDIVGLKKTSPSGGCLHPVEAYVLAINVEGLEAGIYHYNVQHHNLETMELLEVQTARELADQFTAGQNYPASAHALFIMSARFYRNFWKYRRHPKAYSVLFMDAAHLSQTLYLMCSEMGIGGFFTAAINAGNIEERLGLDGFEEGALAVFGCGIPLGTLGDDPEFIPWGADALTGLPDP